MQDDIYYISDVNLVATPKYVLHIHDFAYLRMAAGDAFVIFQGYDGDAAHGDGERQWTELANEMNWLLGDHLGSQSLAVTASGVISGEVRYRLKS